MQTIFFVIAIIFFVGLMNDDEKKETVESVDPVDPVEQAYNKGYAKGKDEGFKQGEKSGYKQWYDKGRAEGKAQGRKAGFKQGEESGYKRGYDKGHAEGRAQGRKEGFKQGEESGYKRGYDKGRAEGRAQGRKAGFKRGRERGYEQGYQDGEQKGFFKGYIKGSGYYFNRWALPVLGWILISLVTFPLLYFFYFYWRALLRFQIQQLNAWIDVRRQQRKTMEQLKHKIKMAGEMAQTRAKVYADALHEKVLSHVSDEKSITELEKMRHEAEVRIMKTKMAAIENMAEQYQQTMNMIKKSQLSTQEKEQLYRELEQQIGQQIGAKT